MLLRRISKHVTEQNWFAVFIDFLIVVVGVFIGIQVANWNAERVERQKEQGYLIHLVEDVQADFTEFDHVIITAKDRMSVVQLILEEAALRPPKTTFLLRSCVYKPCTGGEIQFEEVEKFKSYTAYDANEILINLPQFDAARHTYETLLSTGDIGILKDVSLSRKVQAYYANSIEVRNLYGALTKNHDELSSSMHQSGLSFGGEVLQDLVDLAQTKSSFAALLRSHYTYSAFQIRAINHARRLAEELVLAIQEGFE